MGSRTGNEIRYGFVSTRRHYGDHFSTVIACIAVIIQELEFRGQYSE